MERRVKNRPKTIPPKNVPPLKEERGAKHWVVRLSYTQGVVSADFWQELENGHQPQISSCSAQISQGSPMQPQEAFWTIQPAGGEEELTQ